MKSLITILLAALLALTGFLGCSSTTDPEPEKVCRDPYGTISTWAGTGLAAFDGGGNPLLESNFYWPVDLTFTSTGIYILDWNNHVVRRVTVDEKLETVMGALIPGDGDPGLTDRYPPGALGTDVLLNHPTHITELPNKLILLTAWHNHKLRQYDPSTGLVVVVCGDIAGFSGDGGPARPAQLSQPTQTYVMSDGTMYVLDQRNQRVRKIASDGTITTVVGNGAAGFSGDGGPPIDAEINMPAGNNPSPAGALAMDAQGRLYISDALNNRVRRVDFGADIIETVAGNGEAGYSGDCGSATSSSLNNPRDIEIGPDGRLYIADELNHRIRAVDLSTGIITTVAGKGSGKFSGDGGPADKASLNRPAGIAFDASGNLYIADTYNHRIRRVSP